MMDAFNLQARLKERQQQHLYRQRRTLEGAQQPEVVLDGQRYLAFCSNDYLGLANDPRLKQSAIEAVQRYGVGSGASHLVSGHSAEHHALEEELAVFTGRQRALLFSTGYMANLGAISALLDDQSAVFEDRLNHASLLDAGLNSGARFQRYLHNDVDNLASRLGKATQSHKLVVTDGVFSMDGDVAPLNELAQLCHDQQAWLMVDDAHGFGVLGEHGAGLVEACELDQQQVPVLMATLGKALGCAGAFIAGSETLIEALIQFARPYIYTTAMPPAVAAAGRQALRIVQQEPERRLHLQHLIRRFRHEAEVMGLTLMSSQTAIQPVLVGSAARAMALSASLLQQGIWVTAIRPPTVPAGMSRLRITLTAAHTDQQLDRLLYALERSWREVSDHG
ncbi:8-amino-7-oxononanoate synthase [Pokkaliibacter plantistimulans]